jgi:hypothetical protein
VRTPSLAIAFFAVLALVVGSTAVHGLPYWLLTAAVVAAATALSWVLYVRRSRQWITESYRLLGEGQLSELGPRVEAELSQQSAIARPVLELLRGEVLFWSGEFDRAHEQAEAIDIRHLPEAWHGALYGLGIASAAFTGRHDEARTGLAAHHAALSERPGFHYLEAVVALRAGDAARARERLESMPEEPPRMPMVRAARALLRAELARAHSEPAEDFIGEAVALGGQSFVPARARALLGAA